MIKSFFITGLLLMLLNSSCSQSEISSRKMKNYIDEIENAEQISKLLSKIDKNYKEFEISEKLIYRDKHIQNLFDSLKVQTWSKADFDGNGLTDLLVVGSFSKHDVICILDKNGKYEIISLTRSIFQDYTFPVVENNKIINYFESELDFRNLNEPRKLKHITLTFKYGDFIEENETPAKHKIEKIEYSTSGCFGTCPVFNLTINSDKTAILNAIMYNPTQKMNLDGNYKSQLKDDKYNEIVNLLNYIDFETLKDNYEVSWTDDQSCTLKITYDGGKIKTIYDYGLIGTFGLNNTYHLLYDLRNSLKWTKQDLK